MPAEACESTTSKPPRVCTVQGGHVVAEVVIAVREFASQQEVQMATHAHQKKPKSDNESVIREGWANVIETFTQALAFLRERKFLLLQPQFAIEHSPKVKHGPVKFAAYMTLLPALIVGGVTSVLDFIGLLPPTETHRQLLTVSTAKLNAIDAGKGAPVGKKPDESFHEYLDAIQRQDKKEDEAFDAIREQLPSDVTYALIDTIAILDPIEKTKAQLSILNKAEKILRIREKLESVLAPIQKSLAPLTLLATAILFRVFLQSQRNYYPKAAKADKAYLYLATARLFVPSAVIVLLTYAIDLMGRFRRWDGIDAVIPQFWVFSIGGLWILIVFRWIGRTLRHILGFDEGPLAAKTSFVANRLVVACVLTSICTWAVIFGVASIAMVIIRKAM